MADIDEFERRTGEMCFWCSRPARWIRSTGMGDRQGACAEHVDDDAAWHATGPPENVEAEFVVRVGSGVRDGQRVWVAETAGQRRLGRTSRAALINLAERLPESPAPSSLGGTGGEELMRSALVRIAVDARRNAKLETERGMEGAARVWRHVWFTATDPLDEETMRGLGEAP